MMFRIQRWHTAFAAGALVGAAVTLIIQWLFWV